MAAPIVTRIQSDTDQVNYTPVAAAAPGDVVISGDLVGIVPSGRAGAGIEAGELGAIQIDEGSWLFPKTASGGIVFALGDPVFWDATNKLATTTATGNRRVGVAGKAAVDADAVVQVILAVPMPPLATTIAALTAATGTADGTVDDVTGAFSQAILNNNFKEMAVKINAIIANLKAVGLMA